MREDDTPRGLPRWWPLLFPLTFVVHVAEEVWCGEGFPAWVSRVSGVEMTHERFLALNAAAWVVMLAGCLLAAGFERLRPLALPFATAVLINGLAHTGATALTATYSPGLLSGLLLWVPLGLYTLRRARRFTERKTFWLAVASGFVLHGLLTLTAALTR
ncbi:MAG TPA: HXXEE domain-containing protein [Pyrinomonadaceae bacterium]|nr:HXXEE domain-containing protein [Pyrinomonadaceae bacterium]